MWRRYFIAIATTGALLSVGAVCLGVYANSYYVFGNGGPTLKPTAYNQALMAKDYLLRRDHPATLILGNSRAEIGLNPESTMWPKTYKPVFNAAMAGQALEAERGMLQHALREGHLKLVVVELDFADFIRSANHKSEYKATEWPDRTRFFQRMKDIGTATLTIDAIRDNFSTLFNTDRQTSDTMTAQGFNPLRSYIPIEEREGYQSVFAQREHSNRELYEAWSIRDMGDASKNHEFAQLRKIIGLCSAKGIPVVLFIPPYHAQYLELIRREGFWPGFEKWKIALSHLASKDRVRLLDFTGYSSFTTEPVPPANDRRTVMRWYWEAGHFKNALGDRVISRIFEDGWGTDLTPETASANNRRVETEREAFLRKSRNEAPNG